MAGLDPIATLKVLSVLWGQYTDALVASGVLEVLRNAPAAEHIDIVVSDAAYSVSNVLRELVGARLPSVLVGPFGAILPGGNFDFPNPYSSKVRLANVGAVGVDADHGGPGIMVVFPTAVSRCWHSSA